MPLSPSRRVRPAASRAVFASLETPVWMEASSGVATAVPEAETVIVRSMGLSSAATGWIAAARSRPAAVSGIKKLRIWGRLSRMETWGRAATKALSHTMTEF